MGKPVVATKGGGVPEIVVDGETGILVPPRDPEAMSYAIACLIADRERAKSMGIAGRKRIKESFTIQESVKRVQEVYMRSMKELLIDDFLG